jgi:xanthine phosphoribosyltransferase
MLMQTIREKLLYLGDGIIDASTLLNHQVDVDALSAAAAAFARRFEDRQIDKVITIEVSGIVPALLTARELGVPMVYARKGKRVTQKDCFEAPIKSRTTAADTIITVDKRMLLPGERVLVVDDFLARGEAVAGIAKIIADAKAELVAVCAVFEKTFEGARERLSHLHIPILSFVDLSYKGDQLEIQPGDAQRSRRLRHLHLHVQDLDRSTEFYKLLGMKRERGDGKRIFLTDKRGFELALMQDDQPEKLPEWFHFGFPMAGLGELKRVYAEMDPEIVVDPLAEHEEGHWAFRVSDPDGYRVEFYCD